MMSEREMNKIRKRNGSSSSSSKGKYRFKRAVVIGRRGGSTTPTNAMAAEDDVGSVSARKLAATLWEMNPSPQNNSSAELKKEQQRHEKKRAKSRLKEVMNGLAASKELLKLLRRVWHQSSLSSSVFSALHFELDRALVQVSCIVQHQTDEEEWRRREWERIRGTMVEELRAEKQLRRQAERLNKKLGSELANAKALLEREKRAKEILEQVCDELARGIGEDKAQVEEIRRESEKVREELEEERQMLQVADVLREERVQMKLSEAKYQFEERNTAIEQLRCELEAYLTSQLRGDDRASPKLERINELEAYSKEIDFQYDKKADEDDNNDEDDDSGDSDLHSIELNMEEEGNNNNNKSVLWTYAASGRDEADRETTEVQWGNICLNRSSHGIDLEFRNKHQSSEHDGPDDHVAKAKGCEDQINRYISLKGLANHILSASDLPFASLTKHWGC